MSQSSIHSATSAFSSYNHHNGDLEHSTRTDKAVASVSRLQSNALALKKTNKVVDDVIQSLDRFAGILKDIFKLKQVKNVLETIALAIESDALVLAPIPSMQYVHRRRHSVSPEVDIEESINTNNKRRQSNRVASASKRPRTDNAKQVDLQYEPSSNGTEYTTTEAYRLLCNERFIEHRGALIRSMIEVKQIPIQREAVYKQLRY